VAILVRACRPAAGSPAMAAATRRHGAAHSSLDHLHRQGSLSAVPWPPPSGRSLLHCDPASGAAVLAEVDTSMAQRQGDTLSAAAVLGISSLLAADRGPWVFPGWGCSGHVLALPLAGEGLLAVVQLCPAAGDLRLRLLRPSRGPSRPWEQTALEACLGPLAGGGGGATQACLAEDGDGSLLLLRGRAEDGACSLHRLLPCEGLSRWSAEALGCFQLSPGRDVLRILPIPGAGCTLLQYSAADGSVAVFRAEIRHRHVAVRQLWSGAWLAGYPNQQIVCMGEDCCLVEYNPGTSTLNIGRFDEHGGYAPPMGDLWRCLLPSCRCIRAVWPPSDGRGPVVLLDGADEGRLALCGLPVGLEAGPWRGLWFAIVAGPVVAELLQAVREVNWLRRRSVLLLMHRLLGQGSGEPAGEAAEGAAEPLRSCEACPLGVLRDLSLREPALFRRVVSML